MASKKNKPLIIFIIGFALLLIILVTLISILSKGYVFYTNNFTLPDNYVIKVIDGDTFTINSGETIRLLCLDTPEKGKKGYENATAFLKELILNKEVILISSITDKDVYNRSLRYVYVNSPSLSEPLFVNQLILDNDYGKLLIISPENCSEMN
jgi:endonuclease YncB( thermonuclease family)